MFSGPAVHLDLFVFFFVFSFLLKWFQLVFHFILFIIQCNRIIVENSLKPNAHCWIENHFRKGKCTKCAFPLTVWKYCFIYEILRNDFKLALSLSFTLLLCRSILDVMCSLQHHKKKTSIEYLKVHLKVIHLDYRQFIKITSLRQWIQPSDENYSQNYCKLMYP